MSAPAPAGALPVTPSEFHAYAFANACLRVYTIVSLRDRFRRDAATQTEVSRGLHWEMAALFDHLSTCKMFGPVPIPTAVVPMLTHYTNLYAASPTPTVDIHAFPFEYNEYMEGRDHQIQGNKWWDALIDPASVPQAPPSQPAQQDHSTQPAEHQQPNGDAQPMSTDGLGAFTPVPQPAHQQAAPPQDQPQPAQAMSTAANPDAPYLAVTQTSPTTPSAQATTEPRFIPYHPPPTQPPAAAPAPVPAAPSASTVAALAAAGRPAILAPPVKAPRTHKKSVKTSEFVDEEPRANGAEVSQGPAVEAAAAARGQEQRQEQGQGQPGGGAAVAGEAGSEAAVNGAPESASHAQRKRGAENIRPEDYTQTHDGPAACSACRTHARACRTARDGRLRRCLECRTRQTKCVWPPPSPPVANGTAPPTAALPTTTAADAPGAGVAHVAPAVSAEAQGAVEEQQPREGSACGPARLVAEVVVTPARRPKRKADALASGSGASGSAGGAGAASAGPAAKRSARRGGRGEEQVEEQHEDAGASAPPNAAEDTEMFEARLASAHGGGAYVRGKLALLVDMARTAEMRLADVLGRVAELEAANARLEGMVAKLAAAGGTGTGGGATGGGGDEGEGAGGGRARRSVVGARTRTRSSPRKR